MSRSAAAPCRLFVVMARPAPVAVVFRRGPSDRVQLIRWRTDDDTFEFGHWFYGRIYERRCDLSPDGEHLVYFASKQTRTQRATDYSATWTAISRPPYLTAVTLWPNRHTYGGGGFFADDRTLLLNHLLLPCEPHPDHPAPSDLKIDFLGASVPESSEAVLARRLVRDGWRQVVSAGPFQYSPDGGGTYEPAPRWERADHSGRYRLAWTVLGVGGNHRGWYRQEFRLRDCHSGEEETLPLETDWADWDHAGRLTWAHDGRLYAYTLPATRRRAEGMLSGADLLADFNDARPTLFPPPDWARTWSEPRRAA